MDALSSWLSDNFETLQRFGGLWVALGVVSLVLTILTLPLIVVRLPADYFVRDSRVAAVGSSLHPVFGWLVIVLKNCVGILLIVIGAIMLFVPGQGVLTMLIGVMLTNFPGKYRLERTVVRRASVLRALNRIRQRAGYEPLLPPERG